MIKNAKVLFAVILILVLMLALSLTVYSAETPANSIISALISKDVKNIEIKVQLSSDYLKQNKVGDLYLFEIMPYQSASQINEMTPVTNVKSAPEITFKVPYDKNNKVKIFAKYVVAFKKSDNNYTLVEGTGARFIDNPEAVASESYAYPVSASKKGLQIQLVSDAQELGVSHTVISLPVNEYLLDESTNNAESFIFDNKTFYINKEKLELLDHKIKVFTNAGINVYLNIVLSAPNDTTPQKIKCMYYPDTLSSATFFAFNTKNKESVEYMQSFLSFIAQRYTRSDREYGFAGSFIIGYEVNSNRIWNNMGARSLDDYLNSYVTAFRIADTALRSNYAGGKTYVSVANNFNNIAGKTVPITDSNLDYSVRDLLEKFNAKIKYAGDIPWNLAINPYPSDLTMTEFWKDEEAVDSIDTPFVTMKNINVICDFLAKDEFLFNTRKRNILISEFGINADPVTTDATLQAAAYAYAYYITEFNPNIEAMIYHRHVDFSGENNLHFGLWTCEEGTQLSPFERKKIYDVFKYIDTEKSLDVSSLAMQLLSISDWAALIPSFKAENLIKRDIYETIPVLRSDIGKGYREKILLNFADGDMRSFYPSDNAAYIELRSDPDTNVSALYAKLASKFPNEYMGIGCVFDKSEFKIERADYITVKFKAEAPADVTNLDFMIRLYSKGDSASKSLQYEGVGQVKPGSWDTITFKIDALNDKYKTADSMKIWIKSYDGKYYEGDYGLWISEVIFDENKAVSFGAVILWIFIILLILIAAFFIFVFIRRVIIVKRIRKRRAERARLEAQRRRKQQQQQQPRQRPPQ